MINYYDKQISDIIKEIKKYGFAYTLNKKIAEEIKRILKNVSVKEYKGNYYISENDTSS